jgi:glycosyltransferase involved in cell wall biosynthesis
LNADVLVTLDADGQHDPDEIPSVLQPLIRDEADIAVGSRFVGNSSTETMPRYRKTGIRIISKLVNNKTGQGIRDAQSGFRAYNRKSLEKLTLTEDGMGASVEILMNAGKQGLRIQEVPARCDYRGDGRKHVHNPVSHGTNVLGSIVKLVVEDRPLLFLGIPGTLCLIAGTVFGAWMLQIYATEHHIVTNIALASIGFLIIGFFMLSTAITLYAILRLSEKTNGKR